MHSRKIKQIKFFLHNYQLQWGVKFESLITKFPLRSIEHLSTFLHSIINKFQKMLLVL